MEQLEIGEPPVTLLQRIGKNDRAAAIEFIDAYGDPIWSLAKGSCRSADDAEVAVQDIFKDIWHYAGRYKGDEHGQGIFIARIANRRLRILAKGMGITDENTKKNTRLLSETTTNMNSQEKLRVLFVDDDEDTREMVSIILEYSKIDVAVTAGTAAEAGKLGKEEIFELIILDSQLPDGSGVDLCRTFRRLSPNVPILFYSANARAEDVREGMEAGAEGYLAKPFFGELAATVLRTISTRTSFNQASVSR